jgi:hypothetical protein
VVSVVKPPRTTHGARAAFQAVAGMSALLLAAHAEAGDLLSEQLEVAAIDPSLPWR